MEKRGSIAPCNTLQVIETVLQTALEFLCHGEFTAATEVLGDEWRGIGVRPERDGHSDYSYAHLLLICGVLTMKLGTMALVERAGDTARDLLSESERLFGDCPEAQASRLWVGVSYIDEGAFNEAIAWSQTIRAGKSLDLDGEFSATLTQAIAEMRLGNPLKGIESLNSIAPLVSAVKPLVRGKYYMQYGVGYWALERHDLALEAWGNAEEYFLEAGSRRFATMAMNNIAHVYLEEGNYSRAHVFSNKALGQIRSLGDKGYEAKILDSIAQIYVREAKFDQAVQFAAKSAEMLEGTDQQAWLAESLLTLGRAYAGLSTARAVPAFDRAIEISERLGNAHDVDKVHKELWKIVKSAKETVEALKSIESRVIARTLEKNNGAITATANELGLHHQILTSRLQRLNLSEKRQSPVKRKTSKPRKKLQ